jgi:tRNA A-37 threonylcarbamoyl transferase component Bud32
MLKILKKEVMVILEKQYIFLQQKNLTTVDGAFAYEGVDLYKKGLGNRRRTRIEMEEQGTKHIFYLKRYQGYHFFSSSPAKIEFNNIQQAQKAQIPTMEAVIWGEDKKRSYLVVTSVPGESLEKCLPSFLEEHKKDDKIALLTNKLALLVQKFHRAGYVHRDLYSCHIFLDTRDFSLHLIDLARMFAPRWRKFRWQVKDLAQLQYSMPADWVNHYWNAFLEQYLGNKKEIPAWDSAISCKIKKMERHSKKNRT